MTYIWRNHRKARKLVIRDVDNKKAVELELVFQDGTDERIWLLRGEY